jgi:hypothetical protein
MLYNLLFVFIFHEWFIVLDIAQGMKRRKLCGALPKVSGSLGTTADLYLLSSGFP